MKKTTKKEPKFYTLAWIDDEGAFHDLGEHLTSDPKRLLFNEICKFGIIAPNTFQFFEYDKLIENIKVGQKSAELGIEHYWAEVDGIQGMQVLSLMEVKTEKQHAQWN